MIDTKGLLDQVLGAGRAGGGLGGLGAGLGGALGGLGGLRQKLGDSSLDSFGGGAAVGGLLGMLLGGGGRGGRLVKMGGAAAIGALALRALQNYQQGKAAQAAPQLTPEQIDAIPPQNLPHAQPAGDGRSLELLMLQAMIGAAKADGVMSAEEQQLVFARVEQFGLDAGAKAQVFDLLAKPLDVSQLGARTGSEAQRGEIYLAARLVSGVDQPAERAYLDQLAARLELPVTLRAHLDAQVPA